MNKILFAIVLVFSFFTASISADALKNTLMNMKSEGSSSGMMGLDDLSLNEKPKKNIQRVKRRSSKTILATVNGHKILKRDADKYLKKVTKGKVKDYDRLPKKQRKLLLSDLKRVYKAKYFKGRAGNTVIGHYDDSTPVYKKEADKYIKKVTKGKIKDIDRLPRKQRLLVLRDLQNIYKIEHFKSRPKDTIIATVNENNISKNEADDYIEKATNGSIKDYDRLDEKQKLLVVKDLARPILLANEADNNMSSEQKEAIFRQMWLEKQMMITEVSNEEMIELYEAMKKKSLATNPNAQIPPYISLGDKLKKQVMEKKIMDKLMVDVKIVVNYDNNQSSDSNNSNKTLETLDKISQ